MTKLHYVKRARKAYPKQGIKKGDQYWWWKFRVGSRSSGKIRSATKPRPSRLTRSEFHSAILAAQEAVNDAVGAGGDKLVAALEDAKSTVESLGEECRERYDGMSERFPNGCPTMELLEQRAEACKWIICGINAAIGDIGNVGSHDDPTETYDAATAVAGISWGVE